MAKIMKVKVGAAPGVAESVNEGGQSVVVASKRNGHYHGTNIKKIKWLLMVGLISNDICQGALSKIRRQKEKGIEY